MCACVHVHMYVYVCVYVCECMFGHVCMCVYLGGECLWISEFSYKFTYVLHSGIMLRDLKIIFEAFKN